MGASHLDLVQLSLAERYPPESSHQGRSPALTLSVGEDHLQRLNAVTDMISQSSLPTCSP